MKSAHACITTRRVVALLQSLQSSRHNIINSLCCIFARTKDSTARACACQEGYGIHHHQQRYCPWEIKYICFKNLKIDLQCSILSTRSRSNKSRSVYDCKIWTIFVFHFNNYFLRWELTRLMLQPHIFSFNICLKEWLYKNNLYPWQYIATFLWIIINS